MKLLTVFKYLLLEQKNKLSINNLFSHLLFIFLYFLLINKSINIIIKFIVSFIDIFGLTPFLNFFALFIFINWLQIYIFNFNILIKEILDNILANNILHFPISPTIIFHFKSFQMFIYPLNWINHLFISIPLLIATATLLKASFYKITISILIYLLLDYSINAVSIISIILIIKVISKYLVEFLFFCLNSLWSLLIILFFIIFMDKKYIGLEVYNYISWLFNSHYINLLPTKWLINIISSNSFEEFILNFSILASFLGVILYCSTHIFKKNFDGFFYDKNYTIQRNSEFSKINNKFIALLKLELKILFNFKASVIYTSIYIFLIFTIISILKCENDKLLFFLNVVCYIVGMISTLITSRTEKNQILVYQTFPLKFIHVYLSKLLVCIALNFIIAYTAMTILYTFNYFTAFNYLYLSFIIGLVVVLINLFLLDVGLYFQRHSKYNSDFIAIMYLILLVTAYLWSFDLFLFFILLIFLCQHEIRLRIFKKYENGEFV